MMRFINNLGTVSIVIIGLFMVILLGVLDYLTSAEYSFAIFYLIPISFVTWFTSKRYGIAFAVISSLSWLNADIQSIERYVNPTAPYWNAITRLGLFLVAVFLLNKIRKMESTLEKKVEEKTSDLINEISERIKTEEELQKKTSKLSELAQRLQSIKEEENTKIAREIHDELGQAMTAIKIDIAWLSKKYSANTDIAESLVSISDTIDDTIKIIRQISSSLRPRLLDELGFIPAVERYLKDFESRTGIFYDYKYNGNNINFNLEESNALFRIFQEAMTNIARHSKASHVDIDLNEGNDIFYMKIRDDGIGLPVNYLDKKDTLGLIGMRERVDNIGGKLDVVSAENNGTEVLVTLHLSGNGAEL